MKSKLSPKKIEEEENEIEFPLLMKNTYTDAIFLITGKWSGGYIGTILTSNGEHSEGWADDLIPYEGSITLSN